MIQISPNLISDYIRRSLLNRGAPLNGYIFIEQKGVKGGQIGIIRMNSGMNVRGTTNNL